MHETVHNFDAEPATKACGGSHALRNNGGKCALVSSSGIETHRFFTEVEASSAARPP